MLPTVAAISEPSLKLLNRITLEVTLSLRCKNRGIWAMVSIRESHSCMSYSGAISRVFSCSSEFFYTHQH